MKTPKITQEEIKVIKAAQEGNILAFNKLYTKYKKFVETVIYNYIKDIDESQDIANIVFLKVYDKLKMFTTYDSFGGWLRIIASRTAIDYLRETKKDQLIIDSDDVRLTLSTSIDSDEIDLVNRLTCEQILEELEKFPEQVKAVCKMFYVDNLTTEQISKTLSIPVGTIKSHLSRTRSKLKKLFKQM